MQSIVRTALLTLALPELSAKLFLACGTAWHACLVLAFQGWGWQHLCVTAVSHSAMKLLQQRYEMALDRQRHHHQLYEPRSIDVDLDQ